MASVRSVGSTEFGPRSMCNVWDRSRVLWAATFAVTLMVLGPQTARAWSQVELRSYTAVMAAMDRGQWPVAETRIREGLKSAPDSPLLNNLAGAVFLYRGDLGSAESAWRRVGASEPDDGLAAYGRGLVSLARGRLAESETWAERAAKHGDAAACLVVRSYAAHLRGVVGDPDVALPDNVAAARLGLAAAIAYRRGDHQRALEWARTALQRYPNGRYSETDGVLMTFDPRSPLRFGPTSVPVARFRSAEMPSESSEILWAMLTPRPSRAAVARIGAAAAQAAGDTAGARSMRLLADAIQPVEPLDRSLYAPLGSETLGPMWSGPGARRVVALTFDDGPRHGPTERILELLRRHDARATFFVVGRHAAASPGLVAELARAGMEVANHSFTHPNLTRLDDRSIREELVRTSACVADAAGRMPAFFRPPGGQANDRIFRLAAEVGLRACMWTVNAEYSERIGPQSVVQHVLAQVRPGAIVLLHNGSEATLAALPEILVTLRRRGYAFVTVSELADMGT